MHTSGRWSTTTCLALVCLTLVVFAVVPGVASATSSYSDAVLDTPGLLHYWRLNETSGTSFADSKGSATATVAGGATLGVTGAVSGDSDLAARFDGTNDAASASLNLSGKTKLTVEFWLKWDPFADNDKLAMEFTPNFNSNAGGFLVDPNAPQSSGAFGVAIGDSSNRNNAYFTRPSAAAWHHYAFVFDTTAAGASQISPYVDGSPVAYSKSGSSTSAGSFANSTLYFMSRAGSSLFGNGDLDEVAIYDQALSAERIAEHFASHGANRRPVADFDADPAAPVTGQEVTFDASGSSDPDGTIERYEWDLDGNGSFETDTDDVGEAKTTFGAVGDATVRLRVTDDGGGTDIESLVVSVASPGDPPTASFTATPNPVVAGQSVAFDASASADPDGTIAKYEWDLDGNGSYETDTGTKPTTSSSYSSKGGVTVGLRVTDDDSQGSTTTRGVSVRAPGSASYPGAVIGTPGLLHYWRLGESSGTSLTDAVGSSTATTAGGATLGVTGAVTGDPNTATRFDGSDDAASASVDLSGKTKLTVEFWLKWNAFANNDDLAMEFTPNFNANAGGFLIDPNAPQSGGTFGVAIGDSSNRNNAYFARPSAGEWHHYALVFDTTVAGASQITPYVDGQAVSYSKTSSSASAGAFASSSLYFMSRAGSSLFGAGDLDEVALYDQALDADTIATHYESFGTNHPPTAAFDANPSPAETDVEVEFDAGASADSDGTIAKYEWDLDGNGSFETDTGTTQTATQTYETSGERTIRLRVTDDDGGADVATHKLQVDPAEQAPTAAFDATPNQILAGGTVNFDASDSDDADGTIVKYEWDLDGNGSYETDTGSTPTTSEEYPDPAVVEVGLRVTDDDDHTDAAIAPIYVQASNDAYADTVFGTSGLTHYWRLGESSGTTLEDAKGSADATTSGSPTLGVTGAIPADADTAVSFDGSNDAATATVNLSATSTITVELWLKWDAFANNDALSLELTPNFNDTDGGLLIDPNAANGQFGVGIGRGGTRNNVYFARPTAEEWHHYAFVLDTTAPGATQITPYIDGAPVSYTKDQSKTGAGAFASSGLYFMSRNATNLFGGGDLDELAIYTRALAGSEIEDHHATGVNRPPVARFAADPNPADVDEEVEFDASNSVDLDGTIAKYEWDLDGNGSYETDSGTTDHTSETYPEPGEVAVKLRVTDNDGVTDEAERAVTIGGDLPKMITPPAWADAVYAEEGAENWGGDWDESTYDWTIQWMRCDAVGGACVDIPDATSWWFTPILGDVGKTLRVRVTGFNDNGSTTVTSDPSPVIRAPRAPVAVSPPSMQPVNPRLGNWLQVGHGGWAGAGTIEFSYRWYRCIETDCYPVPSATESVLELEDEDIGMTFYADVIAENSVGSTTESSTVTNPVRHYGSSTVYPWLTKLPTIFGDALEGHLLDLVDFEIWQNATHTFQSYWERCDPDGRNCVYASSDDRYFMQTEDIGYRFRIKSVAENAITQQSAYTAPSAIVRGAPVNTSPPAITGTVRDGEILHVDKGEWTSHSPISYAYRWWRCDLTSDCVPIDGATDDSYQLTSQEVGHTIKVVVEASNEIDSRTSSAEEDEVEANPLTNLTVPNVAGIAQTGQRLAATTGTWTGSRPLSFARQWQRCNDEGESCSDIEGANDASYVPVEADVDSRLRVVVTATNPAGDETAASAPTVPVEGAPPVNIALPSIEGEPVEGALLTARRGRWAGSAPMELTFQWRRCDEDGEDCEDIAGESEVHYRPVAADRDGTLAVAVSATNAFGSATESAPSTGMVNAGRPVPVDAPSVSGTPSPGNTLTAHTGDWTGTASLTYEYQWQRCNSSGADCADIGGEDDPTYTVVSGDVGETLSARVTAVNGVGSTPASSDAVEVAAVDAPANVATPSVTGARVVGSTLTADPGEWDPAGATIAYRWQRCSMLTNSCTTIAGAAGADYQLTGADVGTAVQAVVLATSSGSSATRTTQQIGPVVDVEPLLGLSFDDGSGPVAADATGHAYAGHVEGATWTAAGRHGGALSFDGEEDSVTVDQIEALDAADAFTVEAWLYPRSVLATGEPLLEKRGPARAWSLDRGGMGGRLQLTVGDAVLTGPVIALGRWTHVAFAYDEDDVLRLFVDGEEVASAELPGALEPASGSMRIGGSGEVGDPSFNGLVDEFLVHNRALGEREVRRDAARPLDPAAAERPLVSLGFDEGHGTRVHDSSGFGHHIHVAEPTWIDDGKFDGALDFSDAEEPLDVDGVPTHDVDAELTIEASVRLGSGAAAGPAVAKLSDSGDAWSLWGRDEFGYVAARAPGLSLTGPKVAADTWTDLALTFDGGTARLFVDGTEVDAAPVSTTLSLHGPLRIGGAESGDPTFEGNVDEVRLYDRALTPTELEDDRDRAVDDDLQGPSPQIALTGDLVEAGVPLAGATELHVEAFEETDGIGWSPGITEAEVLIDDELFAASEQACPDGGCPLRASFPMDLADLDAGPHTVEVVARDALGRRGFATALFEVDHSDSHAPSAPGGLYVHPTATAIELEWVGGTDADLDGYDVSRAPLEALEEPEPLNVERITDETSFVDSDVVANADYRYWVDSVDTSGNRTSATIDVTAADMAPAGPVDVTATASTEGVQLEWEAATGTEPTGYLVYRADDVDGPFERLTAEPIADLGHLDGTADPGYDGYYRVRAVQGMLMGEPSVVVSAKPLAEEPGAPEVTISGTVVTDQATWVDDDVRDIHVVGEAAGDATVASVDVRIDGAILAHDDDGCSLLGCSVTHDSDVDPGELRDGLHVVEVAVTDSEARVARREVPLKVDHGAPVAPGSLAAVGEDGAVRLTWAASDDPDIVGYHVLRATDSGGPYEEVTPTAVAEETYVDDTVAGGVDYYYVVRAEDAAGMLSDPSPEAKGRAELVVPPAPSGLTATGMPFAVTLKWGAVTGTDLDGYFVYRSVGGGAARQLTPKPVRATVFVDDEVAGSRSYTYVVRAVASTGQLGPASSPASASPEIPTEPLRDYAFLHRSDIGYESRGFWTEVGQNSRGTGFWTFYLAEVAGEAGVRWSSEDETQLEQTCMGACGQMGAEPGFLDVAPSLSSDGSQVVYVDVEGRVVLSAIDGSDDEPLCGGPSHDLTNCISTWRADGADVHGPKFSADGKRVIYGGDGIYSIDLDGTDRRQLLPPPLDGRWIDPVESPDGRYLYFSLITDETAGSIWKAGADGTNPHPLYTQGHAVVNARPSPDGRELVFVESTGSRFGPLSTIPSDGGEPLPLDVMGAGPTWAPDGELVMFEKPGAPLPGGAPQQPLYGASSLVSLDLVTGEQAVRQQGTDVGGKPSAYPSGPAYRQASLPELTSPDVTERTRFSDGDGELAARATGRDPSGVGVAAMALTAADQHDVATSDCSEGCPAGMQRDLSVDLSEVTEGTHVLRLVASNAAGTRASKRQKLVVDRTPPVAPDDFLITEEADGDGNLVVSWNTEVDPRLADGTAGSGVAGERYRYRIDSDAWSAWTDTTQESFAIDEETATGGTLTVEVAVSDRAANTATSQATPKAVSSSLDSRDCPGGAGALCRPWRASNRAAAARYAIKWADDFNGNYGRPYPNDEDCTNFVSQALHEGGAEYMGEFKPLVLAWWWRPHHGDTRGLNSPTWSAVENFIQHHLLSGRGQTLGALAPSRWKKGDIVVYDWGDKGPRDHLSIVTSTGVDPGISQHRPRKDVAWSEMVGVHIPKSVRRHNDGHMRKWTYFIIRPKYRSANL